MGFQRRIRLGMQCERQRREVLKCWNHARICSEKPFRVEFKLSSSGLALMTYGTQEAENFEILNSVKLLHGAEFLLWLDFSFIAVRRVLP
jgi:hypothetical protein